MRKYFIAGLIVWLPIVATYFVIKFIVDLLDGTIALIPTKYQPEHLLGFNIPFGGLFLTLLILFLTGIFTSHFLGHKLVALWEKAVDRIPLIRSIYSAVKQVSHALLQPRDNAFRKVLLVEYPRKGIWSIAFQTSEKFNDSKLPEKVRCVFIPTTPNPTSGFLILVPENEIIELSITVEQALRMVISLGVVMPDKAEESVVSPSNKTAGK